MAIARVDLNLFRVFEAVMRHRSVRGASKELGVTASAVSHALSRLRSATEDELFVPSESGMIPTPRALELAPGIRDGLGRIDTALDAKPFVPAEAFRTFRMAATDYVAATILPRLVGRLQTAAPHIDLKIFPFSRPDVVRHLDEGRLDFVFGWFRDLPERFHRTTVLTESEAVVVRSRHPLTEAPVTMERLFAYPHIVVELTGSGEQTADGFVDERGAWRRVWIERLLIEMGDDDRGLVGRVAISVPHYAAVAPMLRVSDMVATLPRHLALLAADRGELVMLDLPYEPLVVQVEIVWHQRNDRDGGARWLVRELVDAMQGLATG